MLTFFLFGLVSFYMPALDVFNFGQKLVFLRFQLVFGQVFELVNLY